MFKVIYCVWSISFLDLQERPRKYTNLLQCFVEFLGKDLLWKRLNNLELAILIIEAQILMHQRPHVAVEQLHLVRLSEAPREALTSALRPEHHLSDVFSAGLWLGRHLFDYGGRPLSSLESDGSGKLLLIFLS